MLQYRFERPCCAAPELFVLARFLIALYYFNICADKYSEYVWRFQYWEYTQKYGLRPQRGMESMHPTGVPWLAAGVVVCATLMIHNKGAVARAYTRPLLSST
jgi:hypothetical protein